MSSCDACSGIWRLAFVREASYRSGDVRRQSVCAHTQGLALPRASHPGEIALSGSRRLRPVLAAAPVLFAHAIVTVAKNK